MIGGDAFSTLGGVATTAKTNRRFPLPATATWNKPTELQSAKKLLALNPDHLAPGHGKIVDSPAAAMAARSSAASEMPRAGLDTARVVKEAARIADAEGLRGDAGPCRGGVSESARRRSITTSRDCRVCCG